MIRLPLGVGNLAAATLAAGLALSPALGSINQEGLEILTLLLAASSLLIASGRVPLGNRPFGLGCLVTALFGCGILIGQMRLAAIGAGDFQLKLSGLANLLGPLRERAISGMTAGMGEREAALVSGFVLGRDEQIDPVTIEYFRRSGLAHLLAVSGQNVMLLILLGSLPLMVAGVPLRLRLFFLCPLLLIYLGLTGAEPSIQRATVMGLVMLLMVWLGRPQQRLFALVMALLVTLLVDPRMTGDVGWQLSFAATGGIMLLAPGLRDLLLTTTEDQPSGTVWRPIADAAAVTIAAGLATAPLIAHHFEALPLGTISANLLALPAVAPVMWLGMSAGMLGQLSLLHTEPINAVNSLLIAYIAGVAEKIGSLRGGVLALSLGPSWLVTLVLAGLLAASYWGLARIRGDSKGRLSRAVLISAVAIATLLPIAAALLPPAPIGSGQGVPVGLRIVALDVGQGDALLVQRDGRNLLIDTGPPGPNLSRRLRSYGVHRLDAVFITHSDLDHVGGLTPLVRKTEVARLIVADPSIPDRLLSRDRNPAVTRVAAGDLIRLADLKIEVLWPPIRTSPISDDNSNSLVLLLSWHDFSALFTGDAEAESAGYAAPDIDLLKVAHHGSRDAGLERLLEQTTPRHALISVGADNRYGHPAPSTLGSLVRHGVTIHRTDLSGDIIFEFK